MYIPSNSAILSAGNGGFGYSVRISSSLNGAVKIAKPYFAGLTALSDNILVESARSWLDSLLAGILCFTLYESS